MKFLHGMATANKLYSEKRYIGQGTFGKIYSAKRRDSKGCEVKRSLYLVRAFKWLY